MIKRFILGRLRQEVDQPEINILLGPRQVGKTTLLMELEQIAREAGHQTYFFDLEQPQVLAEFNRSDMEVIQKIKGAGRVVFVDEFQYLQNASKIFKAIYDSRSRIKLICSGSSSIEIHKHLKESLAGRRFLFRIYPLQYFEIKAARPSFSLSTYLRYGGMPALTHAESGERKAQILSELLSAYILKDVKSLVKEENIRAFNHLLYLLAENQGSVISVHSLAGEVGMSSKAVNRYLDILEETFVNLRVSSYSNNLGNELKKSSKIYLYDLGIRNAILKDFSSLKERSDKGVILESFVLLRLQVMLKPNMEIKFWRTKDGDEVDFVLLKDRTPFPIEVKSGISNLEVPKGLRRFLARYPNTKTAFVVNENQSREVRLGSCAVRFMTFESFAEEKCPLLDALSLTHESI